MPTDQPIPNIPKLRKIWEWVQTSQNWQQGMWVWIPWSSLLESYGDKWRGLANAADPQECGTVFCFAGYAVHITEGVRWHNYERVITDDGRIHHVRDWARKELGLTAGEADNLFCSSNSRATIAEILSNIFARAGETL